MAWICVDMDHTLIHPTTNRVQSGAIPAMRTLMGRGHRLSIYTARFHRVPRLHIPHMMLRVSNYLQRLGVPFHDVHVDRKPPADVFIDNRGVPYHGDWGQTLAQTMMLAGTPHGQESSLASFDQVQDEPETSYGYESGEYLPSGDSVGESSSNSDADLGEWGE